MPVGGSAELPIEQANASQGCCGLLNARQRPPVTVMRPSGSRVTMWSRLAEAVSAALGSIASGRSPLQALCTSLRLTSTCRAPRRISLSD